MNPIDPMSSQRAGDLSADKAESSRPMEALRRLSPGVSQPVSAHDAEKNTLARLARDIDVVKSHVADSAPERQEWLAQLKTKIDQGTYAVDLDVLAQRVFQALH